MAQKPNQWMKIKWNLKKEKKEQEKKNKVRKVLPMHKLEVDKCIFILRVQ